MMKRVLQLSLLVLLVLPFSVSAQNSFFVERSYDVYGRQEVSAIHQRNTNKIDFFIDSDYWNRLSSSKKAEADSNIYNLSVEFERVIYPTLTEMFGSESDEFGSRLTVLFHPMTSNAGGYFRSGDQYYQIQYSQSNERNILYLNTSYLNDIDLLKANLAHEFVHLLTFNQKDRRWGVSEETWLNELRAEWAISKLGYNEYLKNRINSFTRDSSVSLTEWANRQADYGAIIVFAQYIEDHYGQNPLTKSIFSSKVGLASLEEQGLDMEKVFRDWTIAVYLNDCNVGRYYCFKHPELKNLKIVPTNTLLSTYGDSVLTVNYTTKEWAGSWYRLQGGKGDLQFTFDNKGQIFDIPYILCDMSNKCSVGSLSEELFLADFNNKYSSLTVIPLLHNQKDMFNGSQASYSFGWTARVSRQTEAEMRTLLMAEIQRLQAEVQRLQSLLAQRGDSCLVTDNLYYGMSNNQVKCLQQKLHAAGYYPEGLITGNFLGLTKQAVIRFQEAFSNQVLAPLGLSRGTGYVGEKTRQALSNL